MKKTLLALGAGFALVLSSGLVGVSSADAADGQEFVVNGDFSSGVIAPATTDFALTTSLNEASSPGNGDMYDPGIYAIAANPGSLHNQWVEYSGDNLKMVLNGFTSGTQTVWEQVTTEGATCDTPGSKIVMDFNADVANVLPLDQYSDGGANIEVFINGVSIGSRDLTSNDGTPVPISNALVDPAASFDIKIVNHATQYIGNDFSIDNISLKQDGDCTAPTTAQFITPTDPTCDAAGSLDTSLLGDRGDYTLTIDPAYTGPGPYTLTATAKDGFFFSGDGDPFVRTLNITVGERLTGDRCAPPAIGGKTIGFWTNKNGSAVGPALWNAAKAPYGNAIPAGTTFAQAQTIIKNATSSGDGIAMLRAQFIATALNVQYISGYGGQYVAIPQDVATLLGTGTCVKVTDLLAAINSHWAAVTSTKANTTSVKTVLDNINQDVPLVANQCTP